MGSIYIEFPIHELSDIENDCMKACSFGKLEVVGAPKPSIYGVPESDADLLFLNGCLTARSVFSILF
jgi:hypothetical protein